MEPNTEYYVASFEDTTNGSTEQYASGGSVSISAEFQNQVKEEQGQPTSPFQVLGEWGVNLQLTAPQSWTSIATNFTGGVNLQIQ